jgi:hypothetical protein
MERFSATFLQDYLKMIRRYIADGAAQRRVSQGHSATTAAKISSAP